MAGEYNEKRGNLDRGDHGRVAGLAGGVGGLREHQGRTLAGRIIAPIAAMAIFIGAWVMVGTGAFLKPGPIAYATDHNGNLVAIWNREVPWGVVWLDWETECKSTQSKIERRVSGRSRYQESGEPVIYEVSHEVADCFSDGVPVLMRHEWQEHLFGLIPLRPIEMAYTVELPPTPIKRE